MPFIFEPTGIEPYGSDIQLRGRIRSGAFSGPEAVIARSDRGDEWATHLHTHSLKSPEGWPVLPEHRNTVLTLTMPMPPEGFRIVELEGVGVVARAGVKRLDASGLVGAPEFWAMQVVLDFGTEEVDDPPLEWFGMESQALDAWYAQHIDRHLKAGVWLFVRVPLPGSRYIEYEMTAGVEYQDRVWIGDDAGRHRVLLGYHSGHFSLPALRPEELSWLAAQTDGGIANLMWLRAAYFNKDDATSMRALAHTVISALPGLRAGKAPEMVNALFENRTVPGVKWQLDAQHGWVNNWKYSQRNPQGPMSVLEAEDFAYVRDFFS
jgi:hypothetical protein